MKLPELVENIKSYLYNNREPSSSRLDDRQIIHWINRQRALWLRREYNQMREVRNNEKQILNNVSLEIIEDVNSPIIINSNMSLLRSKYKIPRAIQFHISDGILAVRGQNKLSERISYTDRETALYKGNGWFNRKRMFAFKDDDYIWIKYGSNADKDQIIKYVQVEGVFENPLEVDVFNGTSFNIKNGVSEYPISAAFMDFIDSEILKINVQRFVSDGNPNDEEDTVKIN